MAAPVETKLKPEDEREIQPASRELDLKIA